jgi:superfamily I DNA and/or RNA helicase
MANRLDYLFVDEAGQVSVGNLVGMARAAKNIVLLGDQMQLGQPIQGSHPGESGTSILEYYLAGRQTVPPDKGLFLGTSWRMHPEICSFISEAMYERRLSAEAHTANRRILAPPGTAGSRPRPGSCSLSPTMRAIDRAATKKSS